MKKFILYIGLMVAAICTFSCSDELDAPTTEGQLTNIKLSLDLNTQINLTSRAGEDRSDYEKHVWVLDVFVFDGSTLEKHYEFDIPEEEEPDGRGEIELKGIKSGNKYIYAVANVHASNYNENSSLKTQILTAAESGKDAFLSHIVESQKTEGINDGRFLMSGLYVTSDDDIDNDALCVVPKTGGTLTGKIKLIRVKSPIIFNVKAASGVQFTPTYWQVYSLPVKSNLFEQETDCETTYFNSQQHAYTAQNNGSVTFYMLENRKVFNGENLAFRDRMKQRPENASYFVIKGKYIGNAIHYEGNISTGTQSNKPVEATVTYYIPLGYWTNNDYTSFSVRRNTKYTYNVTVNGVDDIVVEVVKEDEETSVEDGNVIYTHAGKIIELDAHYANGVLVFDKEALPKSSAEISYRVKTPYTDGYTYGEGADKDWVKFLIHEKSNNVYSQTLIPYPGDNVDDLLTVDEMMAKLQDAKDGKDNTLFDKNKKLYVSCYVNEFYYDNRASQWWEFTNVDNREMLLLCNTKIGNGSTITDAAYVISQKSIQTIFKTDGSVAKAWGTEWINETINVHPNYGINNEDWSVSSNNNKLTTNNFAKRQNDGRYNMIEELTYKNNNWNDINTYNWDDDITTIMSYTDMQSNNVIRNKAYLACMSRNRDTDGDKKISNNEVKWYLASINQYQDLWVGGAGIDPEAQLFQFGATNYAIHYFSNSVGQVFFAEEGAAVAPYHEHDDRYLVNGCDVQYNNRRQKVGAVNGSLGSGRKIGNRIHAIRCLRNLNTEFITSSESSDVLTVDYAKPVKNSDGSYSISVAGLNTSSLRSGKTINAELLAHNESQENNKPYVGGFTFYKDVTQAYEEPSTNNYWEYVIVNGNLNGGCPAGYRVPSQKELILMKSKINDKDFTDHELLSRTHSSLWETGVGQPLGYWVGGYVLHNYGEFVCVLVTVQNGGGQSGHNDYKLRCVKDDEIIIPKL